MTSIVTSSENFQYNDESRRKLGSLSGKLTSVNKAEEAKVFLASFERAPTATPATTDHFFAAVATGVDFSLSRDRKRFKKFIAANPVLRADLLGLQQKENVEHFDDPNEQAISQLAQAGRQKVVDAFLKDKSSKKIYEQFMLEGEMYKSFSAEELHELVLKDIGAAAAIFDDKAPNPNQPALKVASKVKADDIVRLLAKHPENNEHYFPIVLAFALKYCPSEFEIFWNNKDKNSDWQKQIDHINTILFSDEKKEKYTDFVERIEACPMAFLSFIKDKPETLARLLMHANNPVELLKTIIANDRDKSFSEFIGKHAVDFVSAFKEELFKITSKSKAKDLFDETLKLKLQNGETIGRTAERYTEEKVSALVFPKSEVEQRPADEKRSPSSADINELLTLVKKPDLWINTSLAGEFKSKNTNIQPLNKYLGSHAEINENNSKLCDHFYRTYTSQYEFNALENSYSKKAGSTPDLSYEMAFLIKNNTKQYKKFKAEQPTFFDKLLLGIFGYKTKHMSKVEENKKSVALIKHVLRNQPLQESLLTLKIKAVNSLELVKRQLEQLPNLIVSGNHTNNKDNKQIYEKAFIEIQEKVEKLINKNTAFMTETELTQYETLFVSALDELTRIRSAIKSLNPQQINLKNLITATKKTSTVPEDLAKLQLKATNIKNVAFALSDKVADEKISGLLKKIEALKTSLNKNHMDMGHNELFQYRISCEIAVSEAQNLQKLIDTLEREVELKLQIKDLKKADELSEENLNLLKKRIGFMQVEANIYSVADDTLNNAAADLLRKMNNFLAEFQKNPVSMSLSELESYKKVCDEALKTVSAIKVEIISLSENIETAKPTAFVEPSSAPPSPTAFVDPRTPQATPTASVSPSRRNYATPTAAVSPTAGTYFTPTASVSPLQTAIFSPGAYLSPQQNVYLPSANVSHPGSASTTPGASISQPVSRDGSPAAYLSPGPQSGVGASISPAGNTTLPTAAVSPSATVSPIASTSPQIQVQSPLPAAHVSQPVSRDGSPIAYLSPGLQCGVGASISPAGNSVLPTTAVSPSATISPVVGVSVSPVGNQYESPSISMSPTAASSPAADTSPLAQQNNQYPMLTASVSPVAAADISAPVTANNSPEVTASVSPELNIGASISAPGTTNKSPEITVSISPVLSPSAAVSPAPTTISSSPVATDDKVDFSDSQPGTPNHIVVKINSGNVGRIRAPVTPISPMLKILANNNEIMPRVMKTVVSQPDQSKRVPLSPVPDNVVGQNSFRPGPPS